MEKDICACGRSPPALWFFQYLSGGSSRSHSYFRDWKGSDLQQHKLNTILQLPRLHAWGPSHINLAQIGGLLINCHLNRWRDFICEVTSQQQSLSCDITNLTHNKYSSSTFIAHKILRKHFKMFFFKADSNAVSSRFSYQISFTVYRTWFRWIGDTTFNSSHSKY